MREQLEDNPQKQVVTWRLHVQVKQALQQVMLQQSRVEKLEKPSQSPGIKPHAEQKVDRARGDKN